jgi:hypothetical protein
LIYTLGPPPSINPAGAIAGSYFDSSGNEHGFLRSKNGAWTTIDVPGAFFTEVLAINPSGTIVGDFCNQTTCYTGFIRAADGSFTTIDIQGACYGSTLPTGGINPAGVVAGGFGDPTNCDISHGYLRFPAGAVTVFDAPNQQLSRTEPLAINAPGTIAGVGFSNTFVRTSDGAFTTFGVPGSYITWPVAISAAGAVVGVYYDVNGVQHGFLLPP